MKKEANTSVILYRVYVVVAAMSFMFQSIHKSIFFSWFEVSQALQAEMLDAIWEFSSVSHITAVKMCTSWTLSSCEVLNFFAYQQLSIIRLFLL